MTLSKEINKEGIIIESSGVFLRVRIVNVREHIRTLELLENVTIEEHTYFAGYQWETRSAVMSEEEFHNARGSRLGVAMGI